MEIRPWNNEIQRLGENLGNHWNSCDRLFISVFREEEGRETNSPQVGFNVWLVQEFARCIRLKNKEIDQYMQVVDHVMQDLTKILDIVQIDSFDSQEEFDWFRGCIRFLRADLPQVRIAVRDLLSSGTFGRNDRDALYAFFTFHGKLKELSKYCLLRMDVKRVQRKLVNRALFRINAELWEAIKSKGRTPIKEFLHQSKYRLENLNRLRSVERINYHLVDGIVFADKAYNPQLYKPSKNRVIQDVRSLSLDLGDNDIISGSFSLDREFEGFIATDSGVAESPVIIAYKGTDVFNWQDIKTDCAQALTCANDVYLQALGLLLSVRDVVGSMRTVRVYGHSLGGGLMQFAVSASPSGRILGYGYNSAGLSNGTLSLIPQPMHLDKIRHFRVRKDCIMATGEQLGVIEQCEKPVYNYYSAHLCKTLRNVLNNDVFVNIV